jgi:hypothetical protein
MVCLVVLFVGMLWAAGVRLRVFVGMLATAALGVVALIYLPGNSYRLARIDAFANPELHQQGDAYQVREGMFAIANGGWFGVGLGEGRLKWGWLPNGHNDFIFAVIAEELGVMGCLVVLVLFGVLAYTGLRIARRCYQPVPPLRRGRGDRAHRRPGDHQHRRRGRADARHRPAAAVDLGRRQRAGRHPGHDRHAGLVRPGRTGRRPRTARPAPRPAGAATLGSAAAPAGRDPASVPVPTGRRGQRGTGMRELTTMPELRSVVLAGGGTGGHIYPLLAFAECLRRHQPDLRITCVGSSKGLEGQLIPEAGFELRQVPAYQLPRSVNLDLARTPARMLRSMKAGRQVLDDVDADVVVGFGGYVAVPAYLAAWRRHTRS